MEWIGTMVGTSTMVWDALRGLSKWEVGLAMVAFLALKILLGRCGRRGWPLVGMMPSVIMNRHRIFDYSVELLRQNGLTARFVGPWMTNMREGVVTCDPRNVEYILNTHFDNFPKGRALRAFFRDLLGQGIFNADDEHWKMQRRIAILGFRAPCNRNFFDETVENLLRNHLLPILDQCCLGNVPLNLQDLFLRFTFDSICINALGVNPGCLAPGLPDIPFACAFEKAAEISALRCIIPYFLWNRMRRWNIWKERELRRAMVIVNGFASSVISTRRKEMLRRREHNEKEERADLLSTFMQMEKGEEEEEDQEFLRDVAVSLIIAGRDTSGVALSWFFWLLTENPSAEELVVKEINGILRARKMKKEDDGGEGLFTREELGHMPYLHAALAETLRLYPSVPFDLKEVRRDDILPDGTKLKAGTWIIYAIYPMARMETIWGPDCLEFKPQRWLSSSSSSSSSLLPSTSDVKFTPQSPYKFVAFNGGPRLCLGKDMAFLQMKAVVATILHKFHVKAVHNQVVVPKLSLTLYMNNGFFVTLHPRN